MTKARKAKTVKRVVLGVGHPWFYANVAVAGGHDRVGMFLTPEHNVFTDLDSVMIDSKGLGNWNKIRLVAEVLK